MEKNIFVVILEDHPMTMDGLVNRLSGTGDIQVAATLTYGEQLEPALKNVKADVLLLDIQVPSSPTNANPYPIWYLIRSILEKQPRLAILVISMFDRPALIDAALEAGVSGYILKDDVAAYKDLAAIVRAAAAGSAYFSPMARQRWLQRRLLASDPILSPRQMEALSLCSSYPDEDLGDLAARMKIANSTLRNLLSRAYIRLEVSSRGAAVTRARQLGVLPPDVLDPHTD